MIVKMKTYRILAAALLTAGLVSCSNKIEFKSVPFAAFDKTSISVTEDAGEVEIAVTAYDFTDPFSVTFETVDGKAVEGEFYEIVGNDARVLRFTPEAPTQKITVEVINQEGTFTGAGDFVINLLTATGDVTLTGNTTCKFNIADLDHPLAAMLGNYTSTQVDVFGYNTTTDATIEADEEEIYKVWINPICHFLAGNGLPPDDLAVYGIVSEDMKTITVPYFQVTTFDPSIYGAGVEGDFVTLFGWKIEADDVVVVDSGITSFQFVWSDEAGGYINNSKFCLGGAISGKLGNFRYLYVPEGNMLLKKN